MREDQEHGSQEREIPIPPDGAREAWASHFPANTVITSKYTVLNFVPKNLWEQLHKAANRYFLFISVVMFIGNYTPLFYGFIKFYSTFAALLIMMTASAVIAVIDDKRRHEADVITNSQIAHRLKADGMGGKGFVSEDVIWADVRVGDVLVVAGEEEFPADLVPLASSSEGGCYVSTANLDGETNLKLKEPASSTQRALVGGAGDARPLLDQAVERLHSLGENFLVAEAPQKSIHTFKGCLRTGTEVEEPLNAKNFLLRGTVLKNTSWVLGAVVYTGPETRMVMNSRKAKAKYANIEQVINRSMLVVVGAQCLMALINDIVYLMTKEQFTSYWYLFPAGPSRKIILPESIGYWLTFFVLYSNLMPISLYFTMEVCNTAQAYFIKNDIEMYDEGQDCPANARTTNLCHELGQVSYIFSDKTGTLTQNIMELKRLSIEGSVYGEVGEEYGFQGRAEMMMARYEDSRKSAGIDAALEVLGVSHTVVSTRDRAGNLKYEAESPDEGALVEAVRGLGWSFTGRTNEELTVEVDAEGSKTPRVYQVLALNAFTSARKRQSVVVRRPSGEALLLVKGADDIMQQLAKDPRSFPEEHLQMFAKQGLRTLVLGRRFLADQELQAWQADYAKAQSSMEDREAALAAVAARIESSLEIVGVTAIEDKLQVGVQDAIVKIRQAGIKLWVLTGDKLETAKNIGFSTRVLSNDMEIYSLDSSPDRPIEDELHQVLRSAKQAAAARRTLALIVTGHALEEMLQPIGRSSSSARMPASKPKGILQDQLLEVAMLCSVVIACRVSPLQKAEIVKIVRRGVHPTPVTLAIGDGANDVPMLQQAQVGVGISGREGRQAVNSADFAIAQFRYLVRLLLVHGRWNYQRACKFVIYSFWKNAVLVLLMFYYTFFSGYAGQSLFEDMVRASYNFVLAFPIITTGMFEQDLEEEQVLANPGLYVNGREGLDLNASKLVEMLLSAAVHSCVIGVVMLLVCHDMYVLQAGDFYTFGTIVFTVLVIAMNYRAAFLTRTWNVVTVAGQLCSFLIYALFLAVYCCRSVSDKLQPWMYGVPGRMMSSPQFWICAFTVPALAMVIDVFKAYLLTEFCPDRSQIIMERWKEDKCFFEEERSNGEEAEAPADLDLPGPGRSSPLADAARSSPRPRFQRWSSYDFAHPGGEPRHHSAFVNSHPTAGDLSLVGASELVDGYRRTATGVTATSASSTTALQLPSLQESDSSSEEESLGGSLAHNQNSPDRSRFAQQQLPRIQIDFTPGKVMGAAAVVGSLLLILGFTVLRLGEHAVEIRIRYGGAARTGSVPFQMQADVVVHMADCDVSSGTCSLQVSLSRDMPPPVRVLYHLDPFYQNFPTYIASGSTSGAWGELTGRWFGHDERQKHCPEASTRMTETGDVIFPCGLQATSLFNDTFELRRNGAVLHISKDGVGNPEDRSRMANPPDYPDRSKVVWLYERFPEVISIDQGTTDPDFVEWMRPSAMPSLLKDVGRVDVGLLQSEMLTLHIHDRFPVSHLNVTKTLVLLSPSALGGKSEALSNFLLYAGCLCWLLAITVALINGVCKRTPGQPRFYGSRMPLEESESSTDSDVA